MLQQPIQLKTGRSGASVNAYLILRKNNSILLSLRQNTRYFDGYFSLVAGHVEDGESATQGMIREAYEEAGMILKPEMLKVVHILHRKSDRFNVDIFFECKGFNGSPINMESEKCAQLAFFPSNDLPKNTIDYIATVLEYIAKGISYSELGWN